MQHANWNSVEVCLDQLTALRAKGGASLTMGLSDDVVRRFAASDPQLVQAIDDAALNYRQLEAEFGALLSADESEQLKVLQEHFINFYSQDLVAPFVAIAARGPWIVTGKGAVIHDSGGYGMMGFGHAPETVLAAMNQPQVMANIMTPSFSQLRFTRAMRAEVGHTRDGACPFASFLCLNSGSESVTLGARIADINTKLQTDPGGRHAGKPVRLLAHRGGFHGRTERPAHFSDSTLKTYASHLATFRDAEQLLTVTPNDVDGLRRVYAQADAEGCFIEAFFIEPVMGEGDPGKAVEREFYDAARELTRAHGSLFLVDSIQAGLRGHGTLSIIDYPGFEDCEPPDMETYSKALNAGQYPLSVLALTPDAAALYQRGVYGNTMTANPRALDVACAVLALLTPELRENIRVRGAQLKLRLQSLAAELDGAITKVQGTGLLLSCELDPTRYASCGINSTEEYLRTQGINVIHGGKNALRYTPHFAVTQAELELLVDATRDALLNGPTL